MQKRSAFPDGRLAFGDPILLQRLRHATAAPWPWLVAAAALLPTSSTARAEEPARGAVVESVAAESPFQGLLKPGDVVVEWASRLQAGLGGAFRSPLDWGPVEVEHAALGGVKLTVQRDEAPVSFDSPASPWSGVSLRPNLAGEALRRYEQARGLASTDAAGAAGLWRALARTERESGDAENAAWLYERAAEAELGAGRVEEALSAFATARDLVTGSPVTRALMAVNAGRMLRQRQHLEAARATLVQAAEIFGRPAPESLTFAYFLMHRALLEHHLEDLPAAEPDFRASLALRERLAPGSIYHAHSLMNLANVRFGDAQEATRLYEGALAIYRRARPQDESSAQVEYNLAELHFNHGDLQSAAHAARQGLLDAERANPEGELAAILLDILAQTESARGDHETARRMLERSVGLLRRAPRDTILFWEVRLAETLSSLGNVSSRMEDWAAAEAQHREAATILAAYPGHSVLHAVKMARVAELLARRGELAEAQALLHEALRVCSEQDSDGLSAAGMLRQLGDVSLAQGNLHEAAEFFQRSLEIRSRLVPGTEYEAQSLHGVGLVHRRSARLADAAAFFARAVDALEAQKDRVGGSEDAKARFADRYSDYYRDVIEALIALDRPAEAFGFLERHRTRALQVMLAQREVGERDIPPDIERDRRALNAEYDRLERLLADAAAGDERERLLVSLARLRSERQALYERLRRASPSYVAARYTVPLDLEQARAALDPGTLLLAFSVGQDSTSLFVVQPKDEPALRVHDLAVTAQELRQQVLSFRQLAARSQASRTEFDSLARGLFELLLGPASVQISRARRLLIIPDGPLFFLPFAALRQDGRYLAELWPIHYTPSATLYGQLKRGRPAQRLRQTRLVAFGDPAYPQRLSANEWVRSAARRGLSLDPLPGTRREVQEIAALFGRRATVYLGAAAREERAKALGLDADYIHFACHGWVDDLLPYDSGLVLAAPHPSGHENGILQAWEVMEQVRIQAELVTLSACDSGLGQETRGEGVIGLARAFHYAGARSVVSSLWAVSDDSTRRLMTRFYKSLAAGRSKDEALQIAQREMIRSRRSRPFHWAAFQLSGDWR